MTCTVVVGGFYGDEGKGKIISHIVTRDNPEIVVRGGAGPNAGHTISDGSRTYKVRMLPSGFLNHESKVMIGPGVVIDPDIFMTEVRDFDVDGRAFIDGNCGIIEGDHRQADSKGDLHDKIGSTGSGTGPANADRAMRKLRLARDIDDLSKYICDVPMEVNSSLSGGRNVLVEGTQGTFLSLWHGTYPFVTSKDVTASGICADVGIGPTRIDEVVVTFKSYVTRVGTGPLRGEMSQEDIESRGWEEFGTVTGRPRRAAEFNYDLARRAVMLNGATQIALTKLDIMFPECRAMTRYRELPEEARLFVQKIEDTLGVPVTLLGTGPAVSDIVDRSNQ